MNIIETQNLTKSVRHNIIYQDITLSVKKGDCYALIGDDNQGKTTFLHTILGFSRASHGTLQVFGESKVTSKLLKRIGFVPDDLLCFEHMSGAQFLDMTIQLKKLDDCLDYAEELIDYFGIEPAVPLEYMDESMNKCVYIISALLAKPELLILDEPFNFLNETDSEKLVQLLLKYKKNGHTSLITADHYSQIEGICSRFSTIQNRTQTLCDALPEQYKNQKLISIQPILPESFLSKITTDKKYEKNIRHTIQTELETGIIIEVSAPELKSLLAELPYEELTVHDISIHDQIFKVYPWMEDLS